MDFKQFKDNQVLIIAWVFILKSIFIGLDYADGMLVFSIYTILATLKVLNQKYPEQDVSREIAAISGLIEQLQEKTDGHSHDITSLKFGAMKR